MSAYTKFATEFADQYVAALAEGQNQFLKTVKSFTTWTPPVSVPPPAAVELPTAREVVEANFAFATKLLNQQKDFSDKLFATSTPAI